MGISTYSTTPASNTSVGGASVSEGCAPSGINDAIRQIMADIATDAVTKTGTQTLTNKTLTSPVITGPTITGLSMATANISALSTTTIGALTATAAPTITAFSAAGIVTNNASGVLATGTVIPNGTTATTQSALDGSTKVATTEYADDAAAAAAGAVPTFTLNLISTTKKDVFSTSSTSLTAITGLSATITPSSNTKKVLVRATIPMVFSSSSVFANIVLMRDATPIGLGDAAGSRTQMTAQHAGISTNTNQGAYPPLVIEFLDSPATSSAVVYSVNMKVNAGTAYINRSLTDADAASYGRTISTITVMEV